MKIGTNIHHVGGHCCRVFHGQRSKVKVIVIPNALLWRRHNFDGVASMLTCV